MSSAKSKNAHMKEVMGFSNETAAPTSRANHSTKSRVLRAMRLAERVSWLHLAKPWGKASDRILVLAERPLALEKVEQGGAKCTSNFTPLAASSPSSWRRPSTASLFSKSFPPVAKSSGDLAGTPAVATADVKGPAPAKNSQKR